MKIFVLNPPYANDFCRSDRWASKMIWDTNRHPDYLLTAVAVLENAGHKVGFLDGAALNLSEDKVTQIIRDFWPDIAVIHSTTPSIYNDIYYAKIAKKMGVPLTVMVGPHVTANPDETLTFGKEKVDIVVRGEYDEVLNNIASTSDLKLVNGISYQIKGEIFHNPPARPPDVTALPYPAWHKIKPEWYKDPDKSYPFLTQITGRGCVAKCTFCRDIHVMSPGAVRLRDPKQVVDEVVFNQKLFPQVKEIMFETESFTANANHVEGICREILKRNLKFTWSCSTRVDMDLRLMGIMRAAGCRALFTGYEFGMQSALDAVKKGTTLEQARLFTQKAKKLGFSVIGYFMIGAPGETEESAYTTIEFAKSLLIDRIYLNSIAVYPGTEMYKWAKEEGHLFPKEWTGWLDENFEAKSTLHYPQVSKTEMDAILEKGRKDIHLNPKQIFNIAKEMKSISDVKKTLSNLKSLVENLGGGKTP
ncbi:MAG: B12-binding domain-containing radical SAM protein [Nitrospinota bacterium]|nr:B12-binding domain-containing radical SAM protein [Nitrospinota bacterium]